MKEDIIQWNCREFGNIDHQKKQLLEELKILDAKEEELGFTDGDKFYRVDLRPQVEHLLSLEEISWRQKLGCYVLRKGIITPTSSARWHSHRRYNHLRILEVDGVIFEEEFEVTAQVVQFYKNLYKELEGWRPFVEGLEFDCIGDMERVWLERKFEREEIFQVVRDLEGDKALGSNGFTKDFYHHCWRVVEKDVLAVLKRVFSTL